MEEEHQHDHQPAIEPPNAVLKIARIFLSNERDAFLAAELVGSFFPLGEGWTLVAAVKHGYNRLVLRVAQEPMVDCTARLLRLHDFNNALSMAVVLGDITLAKLLVTSMVNMRITTAIGVAARCGQLGFLQWVYTNYFDACWGGTEMTKAARFGHLDTLIWLQNETIRRGPQHLLGHAARHLSSDIVNWVVDRRREEPQLSDLIVAVEHGRLKNLEILVARMQPPLRIPALHAARNGHLHVIKWLEINYGEFTEQVMDAAAQNGHLDILYHLRQHRTEGCSMRAIVLAATNGHLSTVQWIVGNYPDKVSPDALRAAISSGRTKVAQWLHSEVNIAWRGNLVECAARHGSRELVAWTLVAFPHQWTPAAMDNAALAGNAELFFMFHNARKTCMSNAVDDFAAHGNLVMRVAPLTQWTTPQPMGHLDVVKHLHGIGTSEFAADGSHDLSVLQGFNPYGAGSTLNVRSQESFMSASPRSRPPDPGGGTPAASGVVEVGVALGPTSASSSVPGASVPIGGANTPPTHVHTSPQGTSQGSPTDQGLPSCNISASSNLSVSSNAHESEANETADKSSADDPNEQEDAQETTVQDSSPSTARCEASHQQSSQSQVSMGRHQNRANPDEAMRAISAAAAGRRQPRGNIQRAPRGAGAPRRNSRQAGSGSNQSSSEGPGTTPTVGAGQAASAWARPLAGTSAAAAAPKTVTVDPTAVARHQDLLVVRETVRAEIQSHKTQYALHYACATRSANVVLGENQREMTALEWDTLELYLNRKIHLADIPQFALETMTAVEVNRLKDFHDNHVGFWVYGPIPPGIEVSNGNKARRQMYMTLYGMAATEPEQQILDLFFEDGAHWECSRRTRTMKMRFVWPFVREMWKDTSFRISNKRVITLRATDSLTMATPQSGLDATARALCYGVELIGDTTLSYPTASTIAFKIANVMPAEVVYRRVI